MTAKTGKRKASMFAPGRGARRFAMTRRQMRRQLARLDAHANELTCGLIRLTGECDAATAECAAYRTALEGAVLKIADLEDALRDREELVATVTRLRSELANLTAVSMPCATDKPSQDEPDAAARPASDTAELDVVPDPSAGGATAAAWRPPLRSFTVAALNTTSPSAGTASADQADQEHS